MLDRIFDSDNIVFRTIGIIGQLWLLNFIWIICSIPIFTMGASTSALIYACMKVKKQEGYVIPNFFKSFKENFKQATGLFFIYAITGTVLVANWIFLNHKQGSIVTLLVILTSVLIVVYFMSLIYVFAVQAKFVNPIKKTIAYSFVIAVRYFKYTIQMVILLALVVYANLFTIVLANFVTLSIGIGLLGFFLASYYCKVFERYLPKDDDFVGESIVYTEAQDVKEDEKALETIENEKTVEE